MSPGPAATSADLLILARRHAGLSQAELARRSGTPRSVVGRWERGEVEPGLDALRAVIALCGMDLAVTLVGERPAPAPSVMPAQTPAKTRAEELRGAGPDTDAGAVAHDGADAADGATGHDGSAPSSVERSRPARPRAPAASRQATRGRSESRTVGPGSG